MKEIALALGAGQIIKVRPRRIFVDFSAMQFGVSRGVSSNVDINFGGPTERLESCARTRAVSVNRPESHIKGTLEFYRSAKENSGFWSCFGYDGLAVVFDLPVDAVRSLTESEKRALMLLLFRLADEAYDDLRRELQALEDRSCEDRLAATLHLNALV